jgi:hypothetical protein
MWQNNLNKERHIRIIKIKFKQNGIIYKKKEHGCINW